MYMYMCILFTQGKTQIKCWCFTNLMIMKADMSLLSGHSRHDVMYKNFIFVLSIQC